MEREHPRKRYVWYYKIEAFMGIGVVGTTRARRGWPPPTLQKVQQKECDFNEFRYLVADDGTLIAKWMDN
eukprot:10831805-Ditylum_brightwellii.AAC.1